jgi:hypothetical protein
LSVLREEGRETSSLDFRQKPREVVGIVLDAAQAAQACTKEVDAESGHHYPAHAKEVFA